MSAPISAERLSRFYGLQRGVEDVTFQVQPGEIFGFLGPNGAGKTTTIRVLMGLLRPTSGAARVFGLDCWSESTAVKERVGYLPGDIRVYEQMTGREFLDFFAGFRGARGTPRRDALVQRLGAQLDRRLRQLSKGNRQKLAIVQALMHDPPLLIMDEPSSGLDPLLQVDMLKILAEERDRGKTIFLSSHDLPEVERIADRVGIIRDGRLVAVESVSTLKATRERRMEVVFNEPAPIEPLERLDTVRVIDVADDRRRVELAVRGEVRPLLATLAALPVQDLIYGPPDLEGVFLTYYSEQAAPSDGLAEVAR